MVVDGLDDVLPTPLEIEHLRKDPELKKKLKEVSSKKINRFLATNSSPKALRAAFDHIGLAPIDHVLVPKKEAFDFRKIAIIRPEDLAIYQAVAIMIANSFERSRSDIARGRIYSYRFRPIRKSGRLFSTAHNLRAFQAKSARICNRESVRYLVKCDIANFYDRINIHRIESILHTTKGLNEKLAYLINEILLHWARRDSYGLPVGSNASRILAEVSLFNVDQRLKNAGVKFIRFVDDFRMFARTATQAHSALAMLIEFLDREGLFINTRKSVIERLDLTRVVNGNGEQKEIRAEKISVKNFRIIAGYGGTIPTKYRTPSKQSYKRYLELDLNQLMAKVVDEHFAQPEQMRDILFGIICQERYEDLPRACTLIEMFPQFYPWFVDMLIKNSENIPEVQKSEVVKSIASKIRNDDFLSEFIKASLIRLIGHKDFFEREVVMQFIRRLRRNAGTYLGLVAFDAAQNLQYRADALEVRGYFERSNEWERRRIISLMSRVLPEKEYSAWRRAVRTYISSDPFATAIK